MGLRALGFAATTPVVIAAALLLGGGSTTPTRATYAASSPELAFEPAAGRFGDDVSFLARTKGMNLFVGPRGSSMVIGGKHRAVVSTRLVGARSSEAAGQNKLRGVVNSYVGPRSKWREGLNTFGAVSLPAVYPGIDLAYHGRGGRLEYDFNVAPGADPGRIAMNVAGGKSLRLDAG